MTPWMLLLACHSPDPAQPAETSSPAPEPGDWEDPIVRGDALDLDVRAPELTDVVLAGDQVAFVGQEKDGNGGMWTFSLTDPDAPALLGRSPDIRHIQHACWTGDAAWGTTRDGLLLTYTLTNDGPEELGRQSFGDLTTGIGCDAARVAWGYGLGGGAWAAREGAWIGETHAIPGDVEDVLVEGDRLWVLGYGALTAWDIVGDTLVESGSVALDGTCLDLAGGPDWIAVACGSGGVSLVDRGDGAPRVLGTWTGWAAARTVAIQGTDVWVAGWSDVLLLDATEPATPRFVAAEEAGAAAMAVAAGEEHRVYVAGWNSAFGATATGASAPEVRISAEYSRPGATITLYDEGPEPLWVGDPSVGTLAPVLLEPGGSVAWALPDDASGEVTVRTDDPDEPTVFVSVGPASGLQVGEPAPEFAEPDLHGELWDLAMLHGEVVFLGLFKDG